MSPQMPSVAQYTLPPPKKSAVQTPESNAPSQTSTQTTGGIPPVAQFSLPPSKNKPTVSPDDTSLLGKVKNFAEGALPTIGAIGGGILGGIGGGLVTAPSVFGIPAGAFAGGVAGAGAGGAAGEALKEKLQGQNLNAPAIAATGLLSAGGEAVGGPLAAGIGKLAGVTGEALYKNIGALGTAAKYAEGAKNQIIDALTPRLIGKAYQTAAKQGTVSSPGLLGGAGIEGAALKDVQSAYDGVESAAKALGTKVNQIVKPGLGYATRNINKVNQTIRNYAQNIVKPFYENIAKEPSLDDFITAIQQTRPPKNLSRAALQAWNQMKEDTINTVSSHLKGEQTGITSLSQLRKIAPEGSVPEKAPGNFWDARKIIDDVYDTATKGKAFTDESLVGAKAGYKSLRDTF
ncbi:MAG TPA: hypothetical protein VHA52_00555, partial [Candidatus Babeliaceae bacterium]|nr:hypothetical protein [Candidatus Babeliaceae bacterium]